MQKDSTKKFSKTLVDYFLHITPDFSKPIHENIQKLPKILPITAIEVIKNDQPSFGFQVIDQENHGNSFFNKTSPSNLTFAVKRSSNESPIISIELINEDDEIPTDFKIIHFTPSGKNANIFCTDGESYFLGYKTAKSINKFGLVDINFLRISKSNSIPHSYFSLRTSVRQSLFDPEFIIIYKISIIRTPLKFFDTNINSRYPLEDVCSYSIPSNIAYFCMPEGGYIDFTLSKIPKPSFNSFSLTTFNGQKIYGTSMIYCVKYNGNLNFESLDKNANIYFCESLCFLSQVPLFKKLRRFLYEIYQLINKDQQYYFNDLIPHFIDSIPILNSYINFIIYRFENFKISFKFQPLDFIVPRNEGSIILLMELLNPESIIELFRCILLERKILVHSYHPGIIHSFLEALLSIIFPFVWQCPYVPFCPLASSEIIESPFPFICGMKTKYFDSKIPPEDVLCVDLNTKRIQGVNIEGIQRIEFPHKLKKELESNLSEIYSNMIQYDIFNECKCIVNGFKDKKIIKNIKNKISIEIRDVFLEFLINIMYDYRECLVPFSAENTNHKLICNVFDRNRFLYNKPSKDIPFYTSLLDTQLFVGYIQNCTSNLNDKFVSYKISFFDNCCSKRSKKYNLRDHLASIIKKTHKHEIEFKIKSDYKFCDGLVGRFPLLDKNILRIYSSQRAIETKIIVNKSENIYLLRNFVEKQKMAMICTNSYKNGISWSKFLLTQVYACWFMLLPNVLKNLNLNQPENISIYIIMELSLQKIRKLLATGCSFDNEIFLRILIQICLQNNMIKLASKILIFFKDIGVSIDPVSYGVYHQALQTLKTVKNIHHKRWIIYITAILFIEHLKNLPNSNFKMENSLTIGSFSTSSLRTIKMSEFPSIRENSLLNYVIDKSVDSFNSYIIDNLAEDLTYEIKKYTNRGIQVINIEYSIFKFENNIDMCENYYEIHMNTRHECQYCNRYLYDEQLLSEFTNHESASIIRCSYCYQLQTCKIFIQLNKYKCQNEFLESFECNKNLKFNTIGNYSTLYYSPIILRSQLEKIISQRGVNYIEDKNFYEKEPCTFWNLIWYFKRLKLPSTLFYFLPRFLGLDSHRIFIITTYEPSNISTQIDRPLSMLYASPLNLKEFNKSLDFIKNSINPSMKCIRNGDMTTIWNHLINFRKSKISIESKKWSIYWETLFIVLICSRKQVSLEMFDRHFQTQFYNTENIKQVNISENDGIPTERAISMRKIFGPLFLEKPSGWLETYII